MVDRVVDVQPVVTVWHRWRVGDPPDPAVLQREIAEYLRTGIPGTPPYRWLLQPLDVAVYGVSHFVVGFALGWAVDRHLFGPPSDDEIDGRDRLRMWFRVLAQLVVVLSLFSYARKLLLLIKPRYGVRSYDHHPVPSMDGGFAMSLGFAWSQRNVHTRIRLLLADEMT